MRKFRTTEILGHWDEKISENSVLRDRRVGDSSNTNHVWFDDFDLVRLRPRQPLVRVFVNQVGYEQSGPKSAVVAANFFPTGTTTVAVQLL